MQIGITNITTPTEKLFLNLGGYWELNPDKELHKLMCYRYTIATILFATSNNEATPHLYQTYGSQV